MIEVEDGLWKLLDRDKTIGYALKTCKRCKPIYISPGSYISPDSALELTRRCLKGYKLPEPIRIADKLTKEVKRELKHNLKA